MAGDDNWSAIESGRGDLGHLGAGALRLAERAYRQATPPALGRDMISPPGCTVTPPHADKRTFG
jgi:hypothetical protein